VSAAPVRILDAEGAGDLAAAAALFRDYAASLDFSLEFQGFAAELDGLPGDYARPEGRLLLAKVGEDVAGVVALRPLGGGICEMKRLYVRPGFRGLRLGEALIDRVIAEGRRAGYRAMRLDTMPGKMTAATALYRGRGFRPIAAYYDVPLAGVEFFEKAL
jgi:ribosomal protein S18 acetylase RimI-like enzyme